VRPLAHLTLWNRPATVRRHAAQHSPRRFALGSRGNDPPARSPPKARQVPHETLTESKSANGCGRGCERYALRCASSRWHKSS